MPRVEPLFEPPPNAMQVSCRSENAFLSAGLPQPAGPFLGSSARLGQPTEGPLSEPESDATELRANAGGRCSPRVAPRPEGVGPECR